MTKRDFDDFKQRLFDRGYRKYPRTFCNEDYCLGKGFKYSEDSDGDSRSSYQVILAVYDYTDKDYPGLTEERRDYVGVEVHILVSRPSEGRMEMLIVGEFPIEEIESFAAKFYKFVMENTEPRKLIKKQF